MEGEIKARELEPGKWSAAKYGMANTKNGRQMIPMYLDKRLWDDPETAVNELQKLLDELDELQKQIDKL